MELAPVIKKSVNFGELFRPDGNVLSMSLFLGIFLEISTSVFKTGASNLISDIRPISESWFGVWNEALYLLTNRSDGPYKLVVLR